MSSRPDMTGWTMAHLIRMQRPTILLNRWQRLHWHAQKRHKATVAWEVRRAVRVLPRQPLHRARIHVIRANAPPRPDPDGLIGGLKPLLDVLCDLGFIVDDAPRYLDTLSAESQISPRGCGYTLVEIWAPQIKRDAAA